MPIAVLMVFTHGNWSGRQPVVGQQRSSAIYNKVIQPPEVVMPGRPRSCSAVELLSLPQIHVELLSSQERALRSDLQRQELFDCNTPTSVSLPYTSHTLRRMRGV